MKTVTNKFQNGLVQHEKQPAKNAGALLAILCASLLGACSSGGEPIDPDVPKKPKVEKTADCPNVHIVNLSQDSRSGNSCLRENGNAAIFNCIEERIRKDLPAACLASFDVFVPGTNSEHGAWKHFNQIPVRNGGRGYLSLQYQDDKFTSGWRNGDAAAYDQGVIDAVDSLDVLLGTLKSRFSTEDVRVFGHSKGSHSVALVSERAAFRNMNFIALAQPGRTSVDISSRSDINAGLRGNSGYIHKLSDNLVAATWQNDEVKFYEGKGKSGIPMPEKWGFPGYVWQAGNGTVNPALMRIDHHSNYAGRFTDGLPGNNWQKGEGARALNKPYCATGSKSVWSSGAECDESTVDFAPYLWGNAECVNVINNMIENGKTGDTHYVGYSGPRGSNCKEANNLIDVSYGMEYKMLLGDQDDCRMTLTLEFKGLKGRKSGGKITLSSTTNTGWATKTGRLKIPAHMRIDVKAHLTETGNKIGIIKKDCGAAWSSKVAIKTFHVSYTHPDAEYSSNPNKKTAITLIGNREGNSYPNLKLDLKNNVAWWKNDLFSNSKSSWDMFYEPAAGGGYVEIRGATNEGRNGAFSKWVHLLD